MRFNRALRYEVKMMLDPPVKLGGYYRWSLRDRG